MIRAFRLEEGHCRSEAIEAGTASLPNGTTWVDLLKPTAEEEATIERIIGIDIPTREEMREIESSSRLYTLDGSHVMTATVVTHAETERPESAAVSFVLTPNCLLTVRYAEPQALRGFIARLERAGSLIETPGSAFMQLLDAIVDRAADILEGVAAALDQQSRAVFASGGPRQSAVFREQLAAIGRQGDIVSRVRESLVSLERVAAFARRIPRLRRDADAAEQLQSLEGDIEALSEHVDFLAEKVNFLLNATLGMINIEQSALIKLFSVVAVMFLPPTLIGTVYGMNFEHMPELDWGPAYPLVLVAMVVSMILPYAIFRRKGWL